MDRERAPSDDRWEQRWRRLKGDGETNSASFSGMSTAAAIRPVRWTGDMGKEGGSRQREGAEQAKMIDFFGDVGRRIEEDEEERTGSQGE